MKKFTIYLTLQLVIANLLFSQKSSFNDHNDNVILDCKVLDANTIRSNFCNDGRFNNPIIWPNGTNSTVVFGAGIWLGAKVGNDTLVAIASYSSEYLPGYTDDNGIPHGKENPLFKVYKLIIHVNNEDRMHWPNIRLGNSDQGAPIYFDSTLGSFEPYDYATQTMYYVYTDSYVLSHYNEAGSTAPLKADIKQLNFACDFNGPIGQLIFTEFKIINRSNNVWNDAYIAIWSDDEIGETNDDKTECDTARNLCYSYYNDNVYGIYPVVGTLLLNGGMVFTGDPYDTAYICSEGTVVPRIGFKDLKLKVFNSYLNGQDPHNYRESYRLMSVNGWIQASQGDVRYIMSTGPLTMVPNDTQHIVIARIVARGFSNLQSISILRAYADIAKRIYDYEFSCPPLYSGKSVAAQNPGSFRLSQNFPNPFNPVTEIRYDIAREEMINLSVYDVSGSQVAVLVNERKSPGSYSVIFDGSIHASGVYFYKLTAVDFTESRKMVLIK